MALIQSIANPQPLKLCFDTAANTMDTGIVFDD